MHILDHSKLLLVLCLTCSYEARGRYVNITGCSHSSTVRPENGCKETMDGDRLTYWVTWELNPSMTVNFSMSYKLTQMEIMQLTFPENRIKRIQLEFSDNSSQLIGPLIANKNRAHDYKWECFPLKPVNTKMVKIMVKEMHYENAEKSGLRELRFVGEPEKLTTQSDNIVTMVTTVEEMTQTEMMGKSRDHLKSVLKKRLRMRKKKIEKQKKMEKTIIRESDGSREKNMSGLQMSFLLTLVVFNFS